MEFAVVNNYMGPVATKVMKGYSDDDLSDPNVSFKPPMKQTIYYNLVVLKHTQIEHRTSMVPQYDTFCHGRETALFIDKFSRFFFPFAFCVLNVVYWTTFL